MAPLNPFLRAFFRSALPAQCQPIAHHVLLVPTTEVLLRSKDRDSNTPYADLAGTEDFLASHVLRVPGGGTAAGGAGGNARDNKTKAKQYTTINGRTVVVKDTWVYSNKGFKTLNQAQLLADAIYYPDVADGQQWLVYYISRPLIGIYQATPILPAIISDEPSTERRKSLAEASAEDGGSGVSAATINGPKKKDVKGFGDLLIQFPMISRQMQNGLEKVIRDFLAANDKPPPQPKSRSRRSSTSSQASRPSISDSVSSLKSSLSGVSTVHPTSLELEPEEETLRTSLETAIVAAIDLFQNVDKQQLSLLGAHTELTGPMVERMIERYVTEQVHDHTLFPRLCAIRRPDDSDLESKIRKLADVDIAQVGVPIEDGMKGKRALAVRLSRGVEAFRKMGVASSPEEMLEILLSTQKAITVAQENLILGAGGEGIAESQTPLTVNADVLVSMLLIVVIRSGVRHLNSRLLYMRYFIFIDEVEIGEQGYALATLEAVLAHLSGASGILRKASKRNRLLWQAVRTGDVHALAVILQPDAVSDDSTAMAASSSLFEAESSEDETETADTSLDEIQDENRAPRPGASTDFAAVNGSLQHVFPFQRPPTPPPELPPRKMKKHVSMASLPRSQSASSVYSSRSPSRHKSIDSSTEAGMSGDLSTEKLAQTQDADGNSVLMMAVEAGNHEALKFLLRIPAHFRADFVLEDVNNEGATLLSAAVQSGNRHVTDELIEFLEVNTSERELKHYMEVQDSKGRCFAHYLFHQPHLIQKFGKKLPWRLKDKNGQTPLFALCRSYDHEQYHVMVEEALKLATETQGDDEPLHLDDHVDAKGNTLLHVTNDTKLTMHLLRYCDSDVNAVNDKRFTPLMVASKYGRVDLVRALMGDTRVDMTLKDHRGLTAVELAKDDDVRNRIDDLILLSTPTGKDGRTTTVVRSFFVEDATVRLVLKSGAPNANGLITVTTCRRSVQDFENLAKWLSIECPASWLPTQFNLPSPFLVSSKPSRVVLRDVQLRLDNFFRSLLTHATFATHELVWEFFLMPEMDEDLFTERSKRKAEARVDNIKDDYEPVTDTQEVENFVEHAREQIKGVSSATKKVVRSVNKARMLQNDLAESQQLASAALNTLNVFLPQRYLTAFERYTKLFAPSESWPLGQFYYSLHSIYSTSTAIQVATNRPAYLIGSMVSAQRIIDRSKNSISRSNRWTPNLGGIFEDAKMAVKKEAWEKAGKARGELESLASELRYTQQTIAGELAVWNDEHVRSTREVCRRLAREMIVKERAKLEGMKRALRLARGSGA